MNPIAHVDLREFSGAVRFLSKGVRTTAVKLVNQWALDITRDMFNALPPPISQIQAKRREIKAYLQTQVAQRIRLATSGKRKGKFIKSGKKTSQLRRVHLIVQARRARAGQTGLYGVRMRAVAGAFSRRAQISVGYLKAVLLPVIRTLNPLVKYKMPFAETGGTSKIVIWPGSRGYGRVTPAMGGRIETWLRFGWSLHGTHTSYASSLIDRAWHVAVGVKLGRVQRQMARELQKQFNRVNTRPVLIP